MNFLIDTNILIPLEPASNVDESAQTPSAIELHRILITDGHKIFVHPAAKEDIARDKDSARRRFRKTHIEKYPRLPDPPKVSKALEASIGTAPPNSNDWVDNQLLAAVVEEAVDFLISEDHGIRSKARRLGIDSRVLTLVEALSLAQDLSDQPPEPPPAVEAVKAHRIRINDPILQSFREDYPGFDDWFTRCRRQHRQAWMIPGNDDDVAGFCIVKDEKDPPNCLNGKVLKLCSFKISGRFNGFRYGELLLRAVFDYAHRNRYHWIFVTLFEKHEKLIELLTDFGFQPLDSHTDLGELIMAKPAIPLSSPIINDPLDYLMRYGPHYFYQEVSWFVVPIQPRYSNLLFPETEYQKILFPGQYAFGNSIRKAYLCHSQIRTIPSGSAIVFYRSKSKRGVIAVGVVEEVLRSSSAEEIARFVGKRTVYAFHEIQEMCHRPVLAILFRQTRSLCSELPLQELITYKVFRRPPQSINSIPQEGVLWLKKVLQ